MSIPDWGAVRPATTLMAGSDVIAGPGRSDFVKGGVSRQNRPGSFRATLEQFATLQTYPPFELEGSDMNHSGRAVLDLYAGTGVGVALKSLGVPEFGVEIMPEAIATREANGMDTVYNDVWDAHRAEGLEFDTLWASPPCQLWSTAGKGAARAKKEEMLQGLRDGVWRDIDELRAFGASLGDENFAHVLVPLHYISRYRPTFFAAEQVPPVLPLWQAYLPELESLGYSAVAMNLQAEQFGVPQTRKRAILMARADGIEARPPVPTHSKYHNRTPEKLDPGVKKWVSMGAALGTSVHGSAVFRNGNRANAAKRSADMPAPTLMFGARSNKVEWMDADKAHDPAASGERVTVEEAAALQSYPVEPFVWKGAKTKQFLQIGNACPPLLTQHILEALWAPAPAAVIELHPALNLDAAA